MSFPDRFLRHAGVALLLVLGATADTTPEAIDRLLDLSDIVKADRPPKAIKQDAPVYPRGLARAGVIGSVTIQFIIDKEGNVENPYVVKSNNPWFERPAVDAIMGWKYLPGEKDGKPVNTRAMQEIRFNLDNRGQPQELWRTEKGKDHDKLPPELQWETPPEPTNTLCPVYPFEALQAGTEGKASISYLVGPDGRVVSAKLRETTTPEFGLAVLAMIDAWRFKPAKKKDGKPCFATLHIDYQFRTNGQGDVPVTKEAQWLLGDLRKKPERILALQDLDQPLKPLSRRPPVYPTALAQAGQGGVALIDFFVDKNGDAQLPQIVSSTAPEFGYAAVLAVATWRFEVPRKAGKPVVVRARIPVEFGLSKPRPPAPGPAADTPPAAK